MKKYLCWRVDLYFFILDLLWRNVSLLSKVNKNINHPIHTRTIFGGLCTHFSPRSCFIGLPNFGNVFIGSLFIFLHIFEAKTRKQQTIKAINIVLTRLLIFCYQVSSSYFYIFINILQKKYPFFSFLSRTFKITIPLYGRSS